MEKLQKMIDDWKELQEEFDELEKQSGYQKYRVNSLNAEIKELDLLESLKMIENYDLGAKQFDAKQFDSKQFDSKQFDSKQFDSKQFKRERIQLKRKLMNAVIIHKAYLNIMKKNLESQKRITKEFGVLNDNSTNESDKKMFNNMLSKFLYLF